MGACTPTASDFLELAREDNLVPVYREILADTETPVSAYLKIARGNHGFLLESVQGGEKWARYSFLGSEPAAVFSSRGTTVTLRTAGAPERAGRLRRAAAVPGARRGAARALLRAPAGDTARRPRSPRALLHGAAEHPRLRQRRAVDQGRRQRRPTRSGNRPAPRLRRCGGAHRGAGRASRRGSALSRGPNRRRRGAAADPRQPRPATSSKSCWRSAWRCRSAPRRSTSIGRCARSTRHRTCSTSSSASRSSSARHPR